MVLQSEPWSVLPVSLSKAFLLGIIFTICLLLLDFMKRRKTWRRFPPGPPSVPFVGNMMQVDLQNLHVSFKQITKQYGDVFSLQFCWQNIVVLNGFEVMKEVHINQSEDIADRPCFPIFEAIGLSGNSKGVIMAHYGRGWKEQRRFSLSTLRNFGMGKKSLEEKVIEEAGYLCSALQSEQGRQCGSFVMSRAWAASDDFETSDSYAGVSTRDYLGASENLGSELHEGFNRRLPAGDGEVDLFIGGTETSTTTLRWALLFMLLCPDVQSKVQEEIDRVIGRDRKPTMGDMLKMPYTNAVIHETQRYGDIVPLAFPHMTYRDTEIRGYFIPKGIAVLTNLSSVLKDETVWEKPHQFYPEHFLDADGKFVKREAFMAFSAGRRVCPGEQLVRMQLFLFFTSLLQRFTLQIPNDQPRPREDPRWGNYVKGTDLRCSVSPGGSV
ncbi:cytochrome P450 2D20-like isoform X5 [Ascaphus truei]|uniref:cytochrome P450 2D20-like isoform X5 n=1 Tax=Ascaphus truei TaxID=8439 RepID=UPI003F5AA5AB